MKLNIKTLLLVIAVFFGVKNKSIAQNNAIIHSHNDYNQSVPFWNAFANGATSFEADIFLKDNNLFVAHNYEDISPSKTLEALYLKPLETVFNMEYKKEEQLILLIDIKSDAFKTLEKLIEVLKKHTDIISWLKNQPDEHWDNGPKDKWTTGQHALHLLQTLETINKAFVPIAKFQ